MSKSKFARTGILLVLTAGPFLVFLFLYLFGKNQYLLDVYPMVSPEPNSGNIRLMIPEGALELRAGKDQWTRTQAFFEKINSAPAVENIKTESGNVAFWNFWTEKDTILDIETAKGPSRKALPGKPRLFLVDKQNRIRGVYSLINPLSMDTLMLEYSILKNE